MRYKIHLPLSAVLFFSVFANHIHAEGLIRPGYGEFKMINSQNTFTGNIVIEGLAKPDEYIDKKFNVFFLKLEKQEIIKKTYVLAKQAIRKSDEYYYEIDAPDLMISPYLKKDKKITENYFKFLVLDDDFHMTSIKIFDRNTKILNTEKQKIEEIFNAKFMDDFPDYVYEENLRYDLPSVSVRFSTPDWLLVDFYILKKGVDYGYGYYVPSSHIEKQDNKGLGQYLYNRNTSEAVLLKETHLIGGEPPVMIVGKNITYLSCYISVGKSYGHDEIFGLEKKSVKVVFSGSTTGS